MRPFLQALVGDVRVVVTVRGRPSEADLEEHIAEAAVMMKTARVVLVVAGGDLTAQERGKMARAGLFSKPAAVLTNSLISRFIMTAIQWLGGGTQTGFAPEQFQQACDFLAIPDSLRSQIRQQIDAMKARLQAPAIEPVGRAAHLAEEVQSVKESVDARLVRMRERPRSEPPKANP